MSFYCLRIKGIICIVQFINCQIYAGRKSGQHVANIIPIDRDEQIIKAIPVKDFEQPEFLLFATKNGMVKKTELASYKAQRHSKPLVAINLKGDDVLVDVHLTDGTYDVFFITHFGYSLWYDEEEVGAIGVEQLV